MSILINIKMPKIENNKSVKAEIRQIDGKFELGIMTGGYYCSQEWTYYPLVEVPTPHGRLIDGIAIRHKLLEVWRNSRNYTIDYKNGIEDANEAIRLAPTIIEAEGIEDG